MVQSETSTGGGAGGWLGTSVLGWLDEARLHLVDSMSVTLEVVDVAVQPVLPPTRSYASTSDPIEPAALPVVVVFFVVVVVDGVEEEKYAVSFLNSLRACDGKLFSKQTALRVVRVQSGAARGRPWTTASVRGLALALDHYESSIKPFEVGSGGGEGGEGGEGGKADGAGSGGGSAGSAA